jgi:hypothetical protein
MNRLVHPWLRATFLLVVLLSLTGLPLRVHICHHMGSATLFSSCGMHGPAAAHETGIPRLLPHGDPCCTELELVRPIDDPLSRTTAPATVADAGTILPVAPTAASLIDAVTTAFDDAAPPGAHGARSVPLPLRI